jgi:cytochrome P450
MRRAYMTTVEATTTGTPLPAASMHGPMSVPVLGWHGNMLPLLLDPIGYMLRLRARYGDVVTLSRGSAETVFVFSAEANRQVLSDQRLFHNGAVNMPGSPIRVPPDSGAMKLFSGITTMNDSHHKQQRRLLMPAFHKRRVRGMGDGMLELIERHLDGWQVGDRFDLLVEMKRLTLAVAVKTILGLDPMREGDRMRGMMERWFGQALSFPVVAFPYNLPGTPFNRMLRLSDRLEREVRAMITRRREGGLAGEEPDALSMLLQAHDDDGTRLTDDELIGQTTALFVAGHETTASALTWTLFLLAQHPPVLRDLLREMKEVLNGEAPTVEQMAHMPLLDGVINESLRLFPPGLWFLRVATAPTRLGGYEVPEGTRILWTPVATHRDPALYPQPDRFMPERWRDIDPSPYEYLPFGAGPRRCLGAVFAITEMKLALPAILQRFSLALKPNARIELGGSPLATPRYGVPVRIGRAGRVPAKVPVRGNIGRLVELT